MAAEPSIPALGLPADAEATPSDTDAVLELVRKRRAKRRAASSTDEHGYVAQKAAKSSSLLHPAASASWLDATAPFTPAVLLTPSSSAHSSSAVSEGSPLWTPAEIPLPGSPAPSHKQPGSLSHVVLPADLLEEMDLSPALVASHSFSGVKPSFSKPSPNDPKESISRNEKHQEQAQLGHGLPVDKNLPPVPKSASGSSHGSSAPFDPLFSPEIDRDTATSSSSHADASKKPAPHQRDILEILADMKGTDEQQRNQQTILSGRRGEVYQDEDRDGKVFDVFRTSLSPVTEQTEESTARSNLSEVSTIRDSNSSQAGFLSSRSVKREDSSGSSSSISRPPQDKPASQDRSHSRPSSPTKRPISPALAKRAAMFGGIARTQSDTDLPSYDTPSSRPTRSSQLGLSGKTSASATHPFSPPSQPLVPSVSSTSPDIVTYSLKPKTLPPLKEWVRTATSDRNAGWLLDHDTPPSPRPLSLTSNRTTASSSPSSIFTIAEDYIKYNGHLQYGLTNNDGQIDWRHCRVVLISDALLISYANQATGQPEIEKRIQLSGCLRAESVRPSHFDPKDAPGRQVFELVWPGGRRELFACARAVERASWVAAILDVLVFGSEDGSARGLSRPPSVSQAAHYPDARVQPSSNQVDNILAEVERLASEPSASAGPSTPQAVYAPLKRRNAAVTRYTLQDPGPLISPQTTPTRRRVLDPPSPPVENVGRGAWSDIDRKSVKSDLVNGFAPGRQVARDITRLLRSMERQDTMHLASSDNLDRHLNDIQEQLVGIAARLKGHSDTLAYDADAESIGPPEELPTLADKVDYMLTLCNILKESQDKVSSAVENSLRKQGIVVQEPVAETAANKLSRAPTSQVALKAAALDRIENLLTTVLSRLGDAVSPVESPERPTMHRNVTPQASLPRKPSKGHTAQEPQSRKPSKKAVRVEEVPDSPSSGRSTPTVRNVDMQTQTRPVMQDTSIQADLAPPRNGNDSDTSDPHSERRIAADREQAQRKLESAQVSHWSADTPETWSGSVERGRTLPVPLAGQHAVPATNVQHRMPLFNMDPTSDTSSTPSVVTAPDPEAAHLLEAIHKALEDQVKITNANTNYQKEVGNYLQRFDEYLRSEQGSRSQDWQKMAEAIAKLEAQVHGLTVKTAEQQHTQSASGGSRRRASRSDGDHPAERSASVLSRLKSSSNPPAKDDGQPDTKMDRSTTGRRKRSISLPRIGDVGLSGFRVWGAPTSRNEQVRQARWGTLKRQHSTSRSSERSGKQQAGLRYNSLEDAAKAMGLDPAELERRPSVRTVHSFPGADLRDDAPSGPRPFPGPLAGQHAPAPSVAGGSAFQPPPEGMQMPQDTAYTPGPTPEQAAVLEAISSLSQQLQEHQQVEIKREQHFNEMTQRLNEPSEQALSQQRQRELDLKEQEIHRANREAKLDELIAMLQAKTEQQDALLHKIAEDQAALAARAQDPQVHSPTQEDVDRIMMSLKGGVEGQFEEFKSEVSAEVKKALEAVAILREQKKALQHELSDLFAFKARQFGGAPDRQAAISAPPSVAGDRPPEHAFAPQTGRPRGPPSQGPPTPAPSQAMFTMPQGARANFSGGFASLWGPRAPGRAL